MYPGLNKLEYLVLKKRLLQYHGIRKLLLQSQGIYCSILVLKTLTGVVWDKETATEVA